MVTGCKQIYRISVVIILLQVLNCVAGEHLLWDQVIYGHDGVLTTHSSHPDNVKDFYETAHRYTHTLAVEGGSKKE